MNCGRIHDQVQGIEINEQGAVGILVVLANLLRVGLEGKFKIRKFERMNDDSEHGKVGYFVIHKQTSGAQVM